MLVHQIQRVPGELGATAGVTANQISILVAYTKSATNRRGAKIPEIRTGDLPDQVVRDVCAFGGHCDGLDSKCWNRRLESVCESN